MTTIYGNPKTKGFLKLSRHRSLTASILKKTNSVHLAPLFQSLVLLGLSIPTRSAYLTEPAVNVIKMQPVSVLPIPPNISLPVAAASYKNLLIHSSSWKFSCFFLKGVPHIWLGGGDMTLKGCTTQACAACKYQRRKCTRECPLAPYFPADQPKVFLNVHKLFGVSNIVKILKDLEPSQKKTAMDSIIIQANYRDKYPVRGCWEEICRLQYQIWLVEEELRAVYQQLEMYRQHHQQHQGIHGLPVPDNLTSQLELGMATRTNALPIFNNAPQPETYHNTVAALPVSQQHSYCNSNSVDYNSLYMESNDNPTNPLWVPYANSNSNSMAMQPQLVASQPVGIQQEAVEDYDEMHPFFDTIDDRQSYIYSKEAYESSSEESLKDTRNCTEHVAENELKSAAACFSLTSVN